MRTFATFALAMFVSMLGAQIAAQVLAVQFRAREEFILVMVLIGVFAVVSIAIFAVAFVAGGSARAIDTAAFAAAAIAVVPVAGFNLYAMANNQWRAPSVYDAQITVELLVPALFAVFLQWAFVRRRRRGG